jgi:N6-L-threonylcarbamoyladenine synthase
MIPALPSIHAGHRLVLALETSCDETAVALVRSDRKILAHGLRSQTEHAAFRGVVPEIAARAHVEWLPSMVEKLLAEAGVPLASVDVFAATSGPGLVGGLLVGLMAAKTWAMLYNKPFIAVNHLEAHALTVRLVQDVAYPFLLLLVSGGHCQWVAVRSLGEYTVLGGTIDDALGEAYDKVASMMGLGYPGGPIIERLAARGVACYDFPRPLRGRPGCDFSFSGLKTAIRRWIASQEGPLTEQQQADVAASFQEAVWECIADRLAAAWAAWPDAVPPVGLVVAGGVAANRFLYGRLESLVRERYGIPVFSPPIALCTDNAAMVAWAALERDAAGWSSPLTTEPCSRWPLDSMEKLHVSF